MHDYNREHKPALVLCRYCVDAVHTLEFCRIDLTKQLLACDTKVSPSNKQAIEQQAVSNIHSYMLSLFANFVTAGAVGPASSIAIGVVHKITLVVSYTPLLSFSQRPSQSNRRFCTQTPRVRCPFETQTRNH